MTKGEAPKGWIPARLATIAEVRLGRQRSPARAEGPHMRPYMRAANVTWEGIDTTDVKEMDFTPAEYETYGLRRGDILLGEASGSPHEVGKAAIWSDDVPGACFQNTLIRVRPATAALVPFLHLHFVRDARNGRFAAASRGVGIHHLGAETLSEWQVVLPPLPEQRRIVETMESYFTRLDDAVATLQRVQRSLKRYRASVLKAAVEGRLVPTEVEVARAEGRDYEPASVLLERILAERRRRWQEAGCRGASPESVAPDTSALPKLPEGWWWATLDSLCESITDGDHLPPPQVEEGVPFLVIGDVRNGEIAFDNTRFVPTAYYNSIDEKRRPRHGDVLYTVTGSFGIPVSVDTDRPFCVQRHIAILRPATPSNRRYLIHALESAHVFRQASKGATGTAQKTVALNVLRAFVIPVPPLAEQSRIADEVDRLLSIERAADRIASNNHRRCSRLRQSILKWAFEGRLADQDPTDELASVLLSRIKAEREASAPTRALTRIQARRPAARTGARR